jgi:serine/threonine protein kinase
VQKTDETIAIKAVSRQKLTAKLLENLESEINILKGISHRNITALKECFVSDRPGDRAYADALVEERNAHLPRHGVLLGHRLVFLHQEQG